MNKKTLWITTTAAFIALLVAAQAFTAPLGNTIITGSAINMILIVSVMTGGLLSGITVAAVSPVLAKFLSIGPLWSLIPFIALGNIVLVIVWHILGNKKMKNPYAAYTTALIAAALAKFITLYFGIVIIAVPLLLKLPEKQAAVISTMFSIPQLITALIGGFLAFLALPAIKKAISITRG